MNGELDEDDVNSAIVRIEAADEANWATDERGRRYYIGPTVANDGSIDWPERTNEHGNVIDYGPQFDEDDT